MLRLTTQLNKPCAFLAALAGVHAITDVTGFGLAGHALEIARGAHVQVEIAWDKVPLIEGTHQMASAGLITGASGRNWSGYGDEITLPDGFDPVAQLLLSDPQTSGGLLLSCYPDQAEEAIGIFHANSFEMASVIGQIKPGSGLKIISR